MDDIATTKSKGIKSTLYDPRSSSTRAVSGEKLFTLMSALPTENSAIPALVALDMDAQTVPTQFGEMPLGSVLSAHAPLIPSNLPSYFIRTLLFHL